MMLNKERFQEVFKDYIIGDNLVRQENVSIPFDNFYEMFKGAKELSFEGLYAIDKGEKGYETFFKQVFKKDAYPSLKERTEILEDVVLNLMME